MVRYHGCAGRYCGAYAALSLYPGIADEPEGKGRAECHLHAGHAVSLETKYLLPLANTDFETE